MTTCAALRPDRPVARSRGRPGRDGRRRRRCCSTPGRPGAARSRPSTASTRARRPPVAAPAAPDDPLALRAEAARRHQAVVLERLIDRCAGRVVDLRLLAADGPEVQAAATRRALADGVDVVVGGVLPLDLAGHRSGAPDLLVRGADAPDGRPTYHPVLVVWHKVLDRPARPAPRTGEPARRPTLPWTSFEQPSPVDLRRRHGRRRCGCGPRSATCASSRTTTGMLAGRRASARPPRWGGLVGTDRRPTTRR